MRSAAARPSGAGEEVTDAIPRCFAVGSADQGGLTGSAPWGQPRFRDSALEIPT